MKNSIWEKRIPTLIGIFAIVLTIIPTLYLTRNGIITIGGATQIETPADVRISNISDTSFTVSFTTQQTTTAGLTYGINTNPSTTVFDDRDAQATPAKYQVHYITVKNLSPQTPYYFSLTSGNNTYLNDGKLFQVTTAQTLSPPTSQQQPATGTIILPNGTNPPESLIYINNAQSQTLSALAKADGTYLIPLNALRTQDLSSYASLESGSILQLLLTDAGEQSNVTLLASQTNPIPTIILSKDYDLTVSSIPIASSSAKTSFPSFSASQQGTNPTILNPKDNATFSDQQPLFKGTASSGATLKITIHSDEQIQTQVTVDSKGNWNYRPNQKLSPGTHIITILVPDTSGILRSISRSFTVFAEGSQVNQSATPSATATPKPSTTPTATPTTSILTGSPTPTSVLVATPTEIPTPTATPIPFVITPTPALSNPGSSALTTIGIGAGISTILGTLLFLISRGTIRL